MQIPSLFMTRNFIFIILHLWRYLHTKELDKLTVLLLDLEMFEIYIFLALGVPMDHLNRENLVHFPHPLWPKPSTAKSHYRSHHSRCDNPLLTAHILLLLILVTMKIYAVQTWIWPPVPIRLVNIQNACSSVPYVQSNQTLGHMHKS